MEHLTDMPNEGGSAVRVRYWAGAAQAAECDEETLVVAGAAPRVADVSAAVRAAHPGIDAVLSRCSVLNGGRRVDDEDAVDAAQSVEYLPPFVGG